MRLVFRATATLFFAGLVSAIGAGCGSTEIPLADVPRVDQPEPVPIDQLPKEKRPPANSTAGAALRYDPEKFQGGPPR